MKLKQLVKLVQVALVSCSFLALVACAHHASHPGSSDGMMDADAGGAQAAGMGEGDDFGGPGGANSKQQGQGLHKRTYYFDFDSSSVHEQDKPAINANANYLISHPRNKIILEGHTDPRGSREYNVALAERRANAVADILRTRGVNPAQIRVVSYGAERLAVPGHSEQDYQLDRRAVIVYQQK